MKTWPTLVVLILLPLSREGAVAQSTAPEVLQVAAVLVQQRYQDLRSPGALLEWNEPRPILLDVGSLIAAVREATDVTVHPATVEAVIRPAAYRDIPSDKAVLCEPWIEHPQQCSYRTLGDGYGIEFESLKWTPEGWEVIVEYFFTGEERNPGQYEIQWYRVRHLFGKQKGKWVQTKKEVLGRS